MENFLMNIFVVYLEYVWIKVEDWKKGKLA